MNEEYDEYWDKIEAGPYGPRYFDPYGKQISLRDWVKIREKKFQDNSLLNLKATVGNHEVSTVWLGLDHSWNPEGPPLYWGPWCSR